MRRAQRRSIDLRDLLRTQLLEIARHLPELCLIDIFEKRFFLDVRWLRKGPPVIRPESRSQIAADGPPPLGDILFPDSLPRLPRQKIFHELQRRGMIEDFR